jgi:two-component system, cell cycle response regulator
MARILVIEDNPTNLELMSYLLKAYGHTVLTASDGEEGLACVRRSSPELIVCDVQLPKLDGFGVAAYLKDHPALRSIPLIAVTALAMVGDRDKLLAAGFDGYLSKPIDPEQFATQVAAYLSTQPQPRSPTTTTTTTTTTTNIRPADGRKRVTILALDDSPANLLLIRSILEPFGYNVIGVDRTTKAVSMVRKYLPDLIISDLHLRGGESGFDFVKAVKADPRLRDIPFVFLSATVWKKEDQVKGLALGAVKFIVRPIDPDLLIKEVEACLRK